jgi:chromosome segregation ATPase
MSNDMNKIQTLASLNNIADKLDNSGLFKEANSLTNLMIKIAQQTEELEELKIKIRIVTENMSNIQNKIQYYMREMEYLDLRKSYEMDYFQELYSRIRMELNDLEQENYKLKMYVSEIQEYVLSIQDRPNTQKQETNVNPPSSPSTYSIRYENGKPVPTQTEQTDTTESDRIKYRF